MAINVTDLNNRCVTTSTVGYLALALTGWMLSMTAAGWYDHIYLPGTSLMLPFALLLAIIGVLAYLHGRSLDSIAFFAFAALYTSVHTAMVSMTGTGPAAPMSYVGWYWMAWAVVFAYLWLGSFRRSCRGNSSCWASRSPSLPRRSMAGRICGCWSSSAVIWGSSAPSSPRSSRRPM